jgi:hypothetical protein
MRRSGEHSSQACRCEKRRRDNERRAVAYLVLSNDSPPNAPLAFGTGNRLTGIHRPSNGICSCLSQGDGDTKLEEGSRSSWALISRSRLFVWLAYHPIFVPLSMKLPRTSHWSREQYVSQTGE